MNYWLCKTEPNNYSIDDLKKDRKTAWDGVRNYQARNFMRDEMSKGDLVIFYHSNAKPPGAAGIAKVCSEAIADPEQFKKSSVYYDPKSTKDNPRWICRELQFVQKFSEILSLDKIRKIKSCRDMLILRKGNRLSITPLKKIEFEAIKKAQTN